MNTILPCILRHNPPRLLLLDQTELPAKEIYLELDTREGVFEAIKKLRVRGAPAIGIAAAYGMYVCLARGSYASLQQMQEDFDNLKAYFAASRPTAVNLFWALDRMERRFDFELARAGAGIGIGIGTGTGTGTGAQVACSIASVLEGLLEESVAIFHEDQAMSKAIGEFGLTLLGKGMGIMTHCNAGGLATSGYGTALAPIYLGHQQGYAFKVYSNETRPLLQGSRLTAYELDKAGIEVTVLCDSMASLVMKQGKIDAVIVGADRIAANGDTANKIGTSGVAILAKEYGIPFYVAAPTSTFDLQTATGDEIVIEVRDAQEVVNGFGRRTGPEGVRVYNPAFDVTASRYITAIITEKGIIHQPDTDAVVAHVRGAGTQV